MKSAIIGKALVVAWSFTLSNLGPTPQVIDLGPAPTDSAYVPVTAVIRNCDGTGLDEKDKDKLIITFGTSPKQPTNVGTILGGMDNNKVSGYLPVGLGGESIVPADHDLYVTYSLTEVYSYQEKPIEVDVLAYPTS